MFKLAYAQFFVKWYIKQLSFSGVDVKCITVPPYEGNNRCAFNTDYEIYSMFVFEP